MSKEQVEKILEHHGVKGMRWGVHRRVGADGTVTGVGRKPKPKPSTDFKTVAPLRKKPPYALTNMQLKKVNERMNLEQNYRRLNPTTLEKGKRSADAILKATIGTGLGVSLAKFLQDDRVQEKIRHGAETIRRGFASKPIRYPLP